jgi:hypothetical protein
VECDGTNSGDRASPKLPVFNLRKPRFGNNAASQFAPVTDEKISVGRRLIPRTHCGDTLADGRFCLASSRAGFWGTERDPSRIALLTELARSKTRLFRASNVRTNRNKGRQLPKITKR